LSLNISPGGAVSVVTAFWIRVTPFDGCATPVHVLCFQPLARGDHGILDFLRVMRAARSHRLFVAQNQQCLSRRLQLPVAKSFSEQGGQVHRLDAEQSRQLAE
jgi:hypothetical protein